MCSRGVTIPIADAQKLPEKLQATLHPGKPPISSSRPCACDPFLAFVPARDEGHEGSRPGKWRYPLSDFGASPPPPRELACMRSGLMVGVTVPVERSSFPGAFIRTFAVSRQVVAAARWQIGLKCKMALHLRMVMIAKYLKRKNN